MPAQILKVAESVIINRQQVALVEQLGAKAVLVGEGLVRAGKPVHMIPSALNESLIKDIIPKTNGVFTNMKSAIYLFVIFMFAMLCNAQQSIILSSNSSGEISNAQLFKLPIKVHCKFKNKKQKWVK